MPSDRTTDSIHHGPSDEAVAAAYQAIYGGVPSDAEEAVNAAYPIIRADVIAEVAAALRADDGPEWLRPNDKEAIAAWLEGAA